MLDNIESTSKELIHGSSNESEEWEFIAEIGAFAISKKKTKLGVCSYKAEGKLEVSAELLFNVFKDIDYQKSWDPMIKDARLLSSKDSTHAAYLCTFSLPFLYKTREYMCFIKSKEIVIDSRKYFTCEKQALECIPMDENDQQRLNDFKILLIATPEGATSSRVSIQYSFKCNKLPVWLPFWGIKLYLQKELPRILEMAEKACQNYKSYLTTKENPFHAINVN